MVAKDKPCSYCGFPLERVKWNSKGFLQVCDNYNCPKYRQPQGRIKQAIAPEESDTKRIRWTGNSPGRPRKLIPFEELIGEIVSPPYPLSKRKE